MYKIDYEWLGEITKGSKLWFVRGNGNDYSIKEVTVIELNESPFRCTIDETIEHNGEQLNFYSHSTRPYNHSIQMVCEYGFNRLGGGYAFVDYNEAVSFRLELLHEDADRCIKDMFKCKRRLSEIDELKRKYDYKEGF